MPAARRYDCDGQQLTGCGGLIPKDQHSRRAPTVAGEAQSLRLPMAMDRISKLESMLPNIMKKPSDTSSTIIQNIK